jgi:hypothetical protein
MFTGTQEIFVLIIIAVLLFILPRMFSRNQSKKGPDISFSDAVSMFSGRMRLAIIASVVWPALSAAYIKPWTGRLDPFLYIGIGPVLLGWSIRWIVTGFRKHKK